MNANIEKYAAKLLFQYRVVVNGVSNKRRTVEERIIVIYAKTAKDALIAIKKRASGCEFTFLNDDNNPVYFEFIGVIELVHLGIECDEDEVWYSIKNMITPMERRDLILPVEDDLSAIKQSARQPIAV